MYVKRSEIHTKQPSCEKMVQPLKAWVKKSCEIKSGGQEMAATMLMLINFNVNIINSLAVFAWILLLFKYICFILVSNLVWIEMCLSLILSKKLILHP